MTNNDNFNNSAFGIRHLRASYSGPSTSAPHPSISPGSLPTSVHSLPATSHNFAFRHTTSPLAPSGPDTGIFRQESNALPLTRGQVHSLDRGFGSSALFKKANEDKFSDMSGEEEYDTSQLPTAFLEVCLHYVLSWTESCSDVNSGG